MLFHFFQLNCKGPDGGQGRCHLCCFLAAKSRICLALWRSSNLLVWELVRFSGRAGTFCSRNIFSRKSPPTGCHKCSSNKTQNTDGCPFMSNSFLLCPGCSHYIPLPLACCGLPFPLSFVLLLFLQWSLLESLSSL